MMRELLPVLDVGEIRALEAEHANEPLMERAGLAAAETARRMCGDRGGTIAILAGPGNNGGDAFVAARWLRSWFHEVEVIFPGDVAVLPPDAALAYRAFVAAGGSTLARPQGLRPTLVVDGLFGIGLRRALVDPYAGLVEWANATGVPILALDVPTGLDAQTGEARAPAIRAQTTITFLALKPGLLTMDGPDHAGHIEIAALGVEASSTTPGHCLHWPHVANSVPTVLSRRTRNVNKGTFGTLGILGGTEGMSGALILAGRAGMRMGAGKVWLGFLMADPPKFDNAMPELMLRPASFVLEASPDALVIGPGLGMSDAARSLLQRALALPIPIALDADALNLMARDPSLLAATNARTAPTLATPHPGEAARLLQQDAATIGRDRMRAARELSRRLSAYVVLKGAGSVLAYPDGTWDINASGGPALATAGSGDILCGMLGAFLAQGIDSKSALRLAVCLHGAASDLLVERGAGPLGITASELPDAARELLNTAARESCVPSP